MNHDLLETDLRTLFERQARAVEIGPPAVGASARRRVRELAAIAATLLLLAGAGLVVAAVQRHDGNPIDATTARVMPQSPPAVVLDVPGWALVAYDESHPAEFEATVRAFVDPVLGVNGPWFTVTRGLDPDSHVPAVPREDVQIAGARVAIWRDGDLALARWAEGGDRVEVRSWRLDRDDVFDVVAAIDVAAGELDIGGSLPHGVAEVTSEAARWFGGSTIATWRSDDGRTLQLALYAGGDAALARRVSIPPLGDTIETSVRGTTALVAAEGGASPRRARFVVGFWLWEVSGFRAGPTRGRGVFPDSPDFLDLVDALRVVDTDTWRAGLPPEFVPAGEAESMIAALPPIALPDGADLEPYPDAWLGAQRREVIAWIVAEAACAWQRSLVEAVDASDLAAARSARNGWLAAAAWPPLDELSGDAASGVETTASHLVAYAGVLDGLDGDALLAVDPATDGITLCA